MDPQREIQLIDRARNSDFTENELVTFYDNVLSRGGTQALLDAIKLRMRLDFPRAARKKFGAKTDEVVESLTRLAQNIAKEFDLSANKVGNHVKTGGDEQTGKQYICRYLSYKNEQNLGTQITFTQLSAESEIQVTVDYYQTNAKDDNFRRPQTFALGEFEQAARLYRNNLEELGVGRKARAA